MYSHVQAKHNRLRENLVSGGVYRKRVADASTNSIILSVHNLNRRSED
jgi:hypothetical protein